MKSAHKIDTTLQHTRHIERLKELLLSRKYSSQSNTALPRVALQPIVSRIEAEYQMETVFRNLF